MYKKLRQSWLRWKVKIAYRELMGRIKRYKYKCNYRQMEYISPDLNRIRMLCIKRLVYLIAYDKVMYPERLLEIVDGERLLMELYGMVAR